MTQLSPSTLSKIKEIFKEKAIFPSDPTYDKAREIFYGGIDSRPGVIIQANSDDDVIQTVKIAKEAGEKLAVRCGGHSVMGHCTCEGGIVLDVRKIKSIEINAPEKTVWVGTGVTAGELTAALDKQNFVLGFGDTGSVGVGGITLGGGIGFLVRKYGLTIDNLLAAKVVTADGQLLDANSQENPDLFWAIRGGGGNFGVVTHFQFRVHEGVQAVGGIMLLPAEPEVLMQFLIEAEKAPEELSTIVNIMPAPPFPFLPKEQYGKLLIMAMMMYVGDATNAEKVLAPFRALAQPIADMVKPMRYTEIFPPEQGSYHPTAVSQTMFMKNVDLELAKKMIAELQASDATMRVVQLRVLGGAMARVSNDATAFAHRSSKILTNVAAFYSSPEEKIKRQDWVTHVSEMLFQGDAGRYVNFFSTTEKDQMSDIYSDSTLQRLKSIKHRYDPSNMFSINHNIIPAES
jgi:FAD/FMN-containing dehydrogenase